MFKSTLTRQLVLLRGNTSSYTRKVRSQSTIASHWPQWPRRWIDYQQPEAMSASAAAQTGVDPAIETDFMSPPTIIASLVDATHLVTGSSWLVAGVATTLALRIALLPTSMRGTLLQTMLRTLGPEATVRFRGAREAFLKRYLFRLQQNGSDH
jgi:membrane protein insertase Oxa1/YidC/SpoIIIJ